MNIKLLAAMRIAFRALRVNKMRSALTMLGIVIGVGAVIAMTAIGSGAQRAVQDSISSIGSNLVMVWPGSQNAGGVRNGNGMGVSLTEDDADAIGNECPSVEASSPVSSGGVQVIYGNMNWYTRAQGVLPQFLTIRDLGVIKGNPFTQKDVDSAAKVCLVGKTLVDNLFGPGADPVGQTIRVKGTPFKIVGLLEPKGQSMNGQDQDDTIIVPISTGKKRLFGSNAANSKSVQQIMVKAASESAIPMAMQELGVLLRQRHHIPIGGDDDFQVRSMQEIAQTAEATTKVMTLLLAGIASVSLVVGGIGIMNTMLISVTERTREIGLRQAVGAKTTDILTQFLVESVTLSLLGGILGILIGLGTALLISNVFQFQTYVTTASVLRSFAFAAFVGIFFGFYPARKAAMLDPIQALRYE